MVGVFKGPVCDDEAYRFYFFSTLVPYVVIILTIASSADARFLIYVQICCAIPLF